MLKFFGFKKDKTTSNVSETAVDDHATVHPLDEQISGAHQEENTSFFKTLYRSLSKTRNQFTTGLTNFFLGKKVLDEELLEQIEEQLLRADVGVEATETIIRTITQGISRKEIKDPQAVFSTLKQGLLDILKPCEKPLQVDQRKPYVILMVGDRKSVV